MIPVANQTASRDFTKGLRLVAELQAAAFLGTLLLCRVTGIQDWFASFVSAHIRNFNLQIAACWLPLGILCILSSLPASGYNFYLQRKFGMLKLGLGAWFRDYLKASVLGFLLYWAILEIAYSAHAISGTDDWIVPVAH